ncbi:MAG: inner-rane translocator, partial [Acidimicrobiales bacterium]|nr:inner-rane translocator [Acidimicrobiales bacterium]
GGLLYGAVFFVGQNIFAKLQLEVPALHGEFHWLGDAIVRIGPALVGVGLGRNPTGFVNDFFVGCRPMVRQVRSVLYAGMAVEVGLWLLALRHSIGNWTFALLTIALIVLLPRIAALVNPAAFAGNPVVRAKQRKGERETPLELLGLDRPFSPADLLMLDNALGGKTHHGS